MFIVHVDFLVENRTGIQSSEEITDSLGERRCAWSDVGGCLCVGMRGKKKFLPLVFCFHSGDMLMIPSQCMAL